MNEDAAGPFREQVEDPGIRPPVPATARGVQWWTSGLGPTAVDEALLSVLSLALALVLIRGASKAEYGVFALVSALLLLFRSAQNSLVLTPLATLSSRLRGTERGSFIRTLSRLQAAFGLFLGLAVAGGIWLFVGRDAWPLALGSGISLTGTWLREFRRALALVDGRPGGALAGDALFALVAAAATVGSWSLVGAVSAGGVLTASGLAAGAVAFVGFPRPGNAGAPATGHRHVARSAIAQARWTLPGTAIGWGQQSGYIYAVGLVLGPAAVGEMVAARLSVVPLLLAAVAWSRMFLPQAARLFADAGESILLARSGRALRIALVGSALYLGAVAIAFVFGLGRLVPADYAGCEMEVLAWGGFAVINVARTIATTALLARLEFRASFAMTLLSTGVSLVLVVALIGPFDAIGAIVGMTAGELLLAILAWRVLLVRRDAQARRLPRVEAQASAS